MDFFKKIIELDKDNANEVDVTAMSNVDLEQMYLVKNEQLKAMTMQYEDMKGQHQTLQMEFDALKRKLATMTKQQKKQRELDKEVIMKLRTQPTEGDEDAYVISLQQRVEDLLGSVASLQQENSKLSFKVENLTAENAAIEERKKQEADAYERKVLSWKKAVKEIHDKDQQLLSELRAKLAEERTEVTTTGIRELSERIQELEVQLKAKEEMMQSATAEANATNEKYVTSLATIKELEARLYNLQRPPITEAAEEGQGSSPEEDAVWRELDAERRRLYERLQEADARVEELQLELSKVRQDSHAQLDTLRAELSAAAATPQTTVSDESIATLQRCISDLETANTELQDKLKKEILKRDEAEQQALEERNQLQKEKEAMSWESMRLEKEIAALNDQLLKRQKVIDGLQKKMETLQEENTRQHRDEIRSLERKIEEAVEERETMVAGLTEQLQAKQAELEILQYKVHHTPEGLRSNSSHGSTSASLGPQSAEQLVAKIQQLQEEAKYREQAVEQFCNDTQEAQAHLREAEDRIQTLTAELMNREMELDTKEDMIQSLREKVDRLVVEVTKGQEALDELRQDAELHATDLEHQNKVLRETLEAKEQELSKVISQLEEQKKETETSQHLADDRLEEQKKVARQLHEVKMLQKKDDFRGVDLADQKKALLSDLARPVIQTPAVTSNTVTPVANSFSVDRLPKIHPALRPAVHSASRLVAKYGAWKVAKVGVAVSVLLGALLVFFNMFSTGKVQYVDTPEMQELKSSLATANLQLTLCLQQLKGSKP